jgi:hypothetical protein
VRWWLAVLFVGLGALLLAAAGSVSYGLTWMRDEEAAFWSGLLVNVGTTLLLGAALVWFERVIVTRVREQNRQAIGEAADVAATEAAERASERFRSLTSDLTARVEDIDRRLSATREIVRQEQEEALTGIGGEISRSAMIVALRAATAIRAIDRPGQSEGSSLIVPAGEDFDAPLIRVVYAAPDDLPAQEASDGEVGDEREEVWLSSISPGIDILGLNPGWSGTRWEPERGPEAVFQQLARQMVRDGSAASSRRIHVGSFLNHLQAALRLAIEAREGDEGARLSGEPVREFITTDCFVTAKGVEFLGATFRVDSWRFEHESEDESGLFETLPRRPENIDSALWAHAMDRGRRHFAGQVELARWTPF